MRRDDVGVLKVGAKADVVVWNGSSPNMLGWSNAIAAIILHANVGDVEHVLIDGEWRKRDFKLVMKGHQTWEEVKTKFVDASKRVQDQLRTPPQIPDEWFGKKIADVEKVVSARG